MAPGARHLDLISSADDAAAFLITLGLNHEQQHQELLLTDIKHVLSQNPLDPAYREDAAPPSAAEAGPLAWIELPGGVMEIGAEERRVPRIRRGRRLSQAGTVAVRRLGDGSGAGLAGPALLARRRYEFHARWP